MISNNAANLFGENEIGDLSNSLIWQRLTAAAPFPMMAFFELTHRCNLICPHCCVVPQDDTKELTTEETVSILHELEEMGVLLLVFSGGEPTVRSDFFDIIKVSVERHFVVVLKTNALRLRTEDVKRIADLGVHEINVSLYHVVPEKHDGFVGREGAWRSAVGAMREFKKAGRNVRASIMVMDWNLDGMLELEEMCIREGWRYTLDFRIEPRCDGTKEPQNLQAPSRELVQLAVQSAFFKRVIALGRNCGTIKESVPCGLANSIVIRPNGAVTPCVLLPGIVLGDARNRRIADIWSDSEKRRNQLAVRYGDHPKCASCDLLSDCRRCPATGFIEHGDFTTPSALDCELAAVWREARRRLERDVG